MPEDKAAANPDADYDRGFRDGLATFAHYKDGVQLVGTTGMTLKDADEHYRSLWNYMPSVRVR